MKDDIEKLSKRIDEMQSQIRQKNATPQKDIESKSTPPKKRNKNQFFKRFTAFVTSVEPTKFLKRALESKNLPLWVIAFMLLLIYQKIGQTHERIDDTHYLAEEANQSILGARGRIEDIYDRLFYR